MNKILHACILLSLSLPAQAADTALPDVSEQYSYTMGVRLGQLLKAQGIHRLDSRAFAAAIDDVLAERPLRLSDEEMQLAVGRQQRVFGEQREQRAQDALKTGQQFLVENARRADVTVLPSGLQYRVIETGRGPQATVDDTVRVHYHGKLLDGSVFDSSVERGEPADFPLGGVIAGFREAISLMHVGDRWEVFIPSSLAYGEQGAGAQIGPNETLVFELQLLELLR